MRAGDDDARQGNSRSAWKTAAFPTEGDRDDTSKNEDTLIVAACNRYAVAGHAHVANTSNSVDGIYFQEDERTSAGLSFMAATPASAQ
jgi:hypothetical protein